MSPTTLKRARERAAALAAGDRRPVSDLLPIAANANAAPPPAEAPAQARTAA